MPDYFALLGVDRRPWMDVAALRERFQQGAARLHPDAGGDAGRFAEWNEAWRVLSAPALRLRHLMELEGVAAASMGSGVPAGLADGFLQMAGLSREHARYLERRGAATGAMARALLAEEAAGLRARWAALGGVLERAAADAGERLRGIDARWAEAGGGGWDGLSALQRELALLDRWEEQVRGARLELSL